MCFIFVAKAHSPGAEHASLVSSFDLSSKRFMFEPSDFLNDQIGHLIESRSQQRVVDVPIGQRGGM